MNHTVRLILHVASSMLGVLIGFIVGFCIGHDKGSDE